MFHLLGDGKTYATGRSVIDRERAAFENFKHT